MQYSIVEGIVHPRIGKDLSDKNLTFYNLGDTDAVVLMIKNIMSEILNPEKSKNIRHVLEDYFAFRAIDINSNNATVKNILNFFLAYEEKYYNKTGFNFYLVKRKNNEILDVIDIWKCERESKKRYRKNKRKKVFN